LLNEAGMTRKKFETIGELKRSPHYVPAPSFMEILTIGKIDFLMHHYLIVDEDDSYVAFACFHAAHSESPVFNRYTDAMRYAIDTYNERIKNENV
jgi:hypothetical protein